MTRSLGQSSGKTTFLKILFSVNLISVSIVPLLLLYSAVVYYTVSIVEITENVEKCSTSREQSFHFILISQKVEKTRLSELSVKPSFQMIAHDRRIAENTASDRQRSYGNTFQRSGDHRRS